MRMFKDFLGDEHDLDDPKTYKRLPQTRGEVLNRLYQEVGYAHLYMMGHDWSRSESGARQVKRVNELIAEISTYFGGNIWNKSLIFWQEKLFIFLDEIENMC